MLHLQAIFEKLSSVLSLSRIQINKTIVDIAMCGSSATLHSIYMTKYALL
ncbi:hypothetical protein MHIR_DE00676 [Candidatus Doolittlea endobia]|uniref:Uncharacterized protein n=1 Tax=Candidatus Doolittlea endobia TaxID=1778262 RepID=A0A143WT40_9ENTR|nr:hypothetical protein MHIR_DE00676 [Candidatus Doolittlea endobia]